MMDLKSFSPLLIVVAVFIILSDWLLFSVGTVDGSDTHENPINPIQSHITRIHDIQGTGETSPFVGQEVTIEGIVVADFQSSTELRGFFVQEIKEKEDDNPSTSEGIFVYNASYAVGEGDFIRLTGIVNEHYKMTQIKLVTALNIIPSSSFANPAIVTLPVESKTYLERFEGMLVKLSQNLTVSEVYNLGRYGEILLSNGRLIVPTNVVAPGKEALALQAANDLNRIILDDTSTKQNPDPIIYPFPELTAYNTVRCGYRVENVTGVLSYAYNKYRIQPVESPLFEKTANPRMEEHIDIGGQIKVASYNVLNYFNGDGLGGGFPTSRGADSLEEFHRQRKKIINAIGAMNADVIGLMEVENDGYGKNSAIQDLVNGLNEKAGKTIYAAVDPGYDHLGNDQIAVGILYNVETVTQSGKAATIDDGAFSGKNRQPLAQTFQEIVTKAEFTVVVNHFKSKGSSCEDLGDPDLHDGQGNCNQTRVAAAEALNEWLDTSPTGVEEPNILIIGDLNAYAMEDPILFLKSCGYSNLMDDLIEGSSYSYVYHGQAGSLDHALASPDLTARVSGVTVWYINTDEPKVLDYNLEFKSDYQEDSLYSTMPFRSSNHDPIIIGLDLLPPNPPVPGDLDHDGDVDRNDYRIIRSSLWKREGHAKYAGEADYDNSGFVGLCDLWQWFSYFRQYKGMVVKKRPFSGLYNWKTGRDEKI